MRNYLVAVIFTLTACASKSNRYFLEIGKELPSKAVISTEPSAMLYEPNSFKPAKIVEYDNIKYFVYLGNDNKVKALYIGDKDFKTDESYKIGTEYSRIKLKLRETMIPGYGYHIELPSGWTAVVIDDNVTQSNKILDTSSIKSFYKTDFGSWAKKYALAGKK